jgi:hypothetical protein
VYRDYGMALSFAGRQSKRARGFPLAGDIAQAQRDIPNSEREALAGREDKVDMARFYAMLGETDMALTWLERAVAFHESQVIWAKADPRFRSLQNLSRHRQIVARLGL